MDTKTEYREFFRKMMASNNINSPLELPIPERVKFYSNLKTAWDSRSTRQLFCVLDHKGKVVASNVTQNKALEYVGNYKIVPLKAQASDDFLYRYRELEEDNEHREALVLLASKYGTRQDKAVANALKVIAEACGYMSLDNQKISDAMNKRLWPKVVKEYNL